jgi:hypothetical protein
MCEQTGVTNSWLAKIPFIELEDCCQPPPPPPPPVKAFGAIILGLLPDSKKPPLLNQEYYSYNGYANSVDVKGANREDSRTWKRDIATCS